MSISVCTASMNSEETVNVWEATRMEVAGNVCSQCSGKANLMCIKDDRPKINK